MASALSVQQIARQLGVSTATVSRALSAEHCRLVSAETRKKVLEYCSAHNYRPNFSAQSLRRGSSRTVGVLMPHADGHYGELEILLDREFTRRGYAPLFSFWNFTVPGAHAAAFQHLLDRQVDGIITTHYTEIPAHPGVPVVVYGNDREEQECVFPEKYRCGRDIIAFLARRGFTKIGAIGVFEDVRYQGMKDEMTERGIPYHPEWFFVWKRYQSDESIGKFFALRERPDAVVLHSDLLANEFYHAAYRFSLRIPEDVSVLSFDNLPFAEKMYPPLTTCDPRLKEAAELLVQSLLERIEDPSLPLRKHPVPVKIVERQSVFSPQTTPQRKGK